LHENRSSGSLVVPYGRTDRFDEVIVAFRHYANVPKNPRRIIG